MLGGPAGTKGFPLGNKKNRLDSSQVDSALFVKNLYNGKLFPKPDENGELTELGVILNRDCNCDCAYCYYPEPDNGFSHAKKSRNISRLSDTITWIIKENPRLKTVAVIGREPLLEFDLLYNLSQAIGDNGKKIGFVTNGLLLNKYSQDITKLPFNYIDISLHMFLQDQARKSFLNEIQKISKRSVFDINCGLIFLKDNHDWIQKSITELYEIGIRNFFINLYIDARSRTEFLLDYNSFVSGISMLKEFCSIYPDAQMTIDIWGEKLPFFLDLFEKEHITKDTLYVDEYLVYAPVFEDLKNLNYKFLMNMPRFATIDYEGYLYFDPDDAIYGRKENAIHKIETKDDVQPALKRYYSKDNPFFKKVLHALDSECRDKACFPFCLGSNQYCRYSGFTSNRFGI